MNKLIGLVLAASCFSCAGAVSDSSTDITTDIINPDCHYQVRRHDPNGWLMTNPVVSFVFWGDWSHNSEPQLYQNAWSRLIENRLTYDRLSEYGIEQPVLNSNLYFTNPNFTVPIGSGNSVINGLTVIDSDGISLEINNEIQGGFLPAPNSETLYVIFLPVNSTTNHMIDDKGNFNGVVGYHGGASYGSVEYAYAIIDYSTDYNGNDWVVNHEMSEAFTNPDVGSGYWDDVSGSEIGDLCDDITTTIDGYQVQKMWSQKLCTCL